MLYLLVTSIVWAFSFGLIGNRLAGIDPAVITGIRLGLALLVFLPPACYGRPSFPLTVKLLIAGAIQFGLMYVLYNASFAHLPSHLVALFTITTPVYVVLLASRGRLRQAARPLAAAGLAVLAAAIVKWKQPEAERIWTGFALVQASNLCFAAGQLLYRRVMRAAGSIRDHQAMAWMYAGGVMLCLPFLLAGHAQRTFAPTRGQIWVLLYLGVIASGICFWLWNIGARRVRRAGTLAVMNNAKIPLGMAASLLLFNEAADLGRLLTAGVVLALAVWLCEWRAPA